MGDEKPVLSPPADPVAESVRQATAPANGDVQEDESRLSPVERARRDHGRFQKKINDVTSRNERLLQAIGESQKRLEKVDLLEREVAELKGALAAGKSKDEGPLGKYSIGELERAEIEMLSSDDAAKRQQAFDLRAEIRRRERESILSEVTSQLRREREEADLRSQSRAAYLEAARLLGDEGANFADFATGQIKNSREAQIADAIFTQLKQKRGDVVGRIPEMQALSVLLAARVASAERAGSDRESARLKEEELRLSRVAGQVSAQGEAAPEAFDPVRAAMSARDIDGVLSQFDFIKDSNERRKKVLTDRNQARMPR